MPAKGKLPRGLALSIVLVGAEVPEVLVQGLVARLLLRFEVSHVGSNDREVLLTQLHRATDSTEASACQRLVAGDGGATGDVVQTAEVQTVALAYAGGCSRTVRSEYHTLVACVGRLLVDLGESAANGLYSLVPIYYCHIRVGVIYTPAVGGTIVQLWVNLSI